MSVANLRLGAGMDAKHKTEALSDGKAFPLTVSLTNLSKKTLPLAQAVPTVVLAPGETKLHTCHTQGHLYDIVFGMIAVGDRLGQETIGSITTKLPKGASK